MTTQMLQMLSDVINGSKIFYSPCADIFSIITSAFQKIYNLKDIISDDHMFNMILKDINSSGSNNNGSNCIAITGKSCRYTNTERIKRKVLAENADNSTEFKIKTDDVLLYSTKPLLFKVNNINLILILHERNFKANF